MLETVRDVLNTMFFLDVEEERENACCAKDLNVKVHFAGESSGEMHLAMPRHIAEQLAANFLGSTPGETPSEKQIEEIVQELGNILCGAFLSRHDSTGLFNLSSPEILPSGSLAITGMKRYYVLEDGCIELILDWEKVTGRS